MNREELSHALDAASHSRVARGSQLPIRVHALCLPGWFHSGLFYMFRKTKVIIDKQVKFSEGDHWRHPDWENRSTLVRYDRHARANRWAARHLAR